GGADGLGWCGPRQRRGGQGCARCNRPRPVAGGLAALSVVGCGGCAHTTRRGRTIREGRAFDGGVTAVRGFRTFVLRGNVVDLAIAVVIGVAFTAVVTAFVKDMVTPLIAALGGKPDFASLYFTINKSKFLYGDFINAVVSFVIIAALIYFFIVIHSTANLSIAT